MRLSEAQDLFKMTMLDDPRVLESPDPRFVALFATGGIPLPERLKVYRNNIVGSLTDAMAATFPLIIKLVGRDFFNDMARAFIVANPPREGCLAHYGAGFDAFIKTYAPARALPYLPDIAAMEIAINDSYYAPDDSALTAESLGAIAPEDLPQLHLKFRAGVRFVESSYPLAEIRDFCLSDGTGAAPDISKGDARLMISRAEFAPEVRTLSATEWKLARALERRSLGEALEFVLNAHPDFDFLAFLRNFIAAGAFAAPGQKH